MKSMVCVAVLLMVCASGLLAEDKLAEDKWNVTLEGRGRVFAQGEGDISISGQVKFVVVGEGTVVVPAGAKLRKGGKWETTEGETLQGNGRVVVELSGQEALVKGKIKTFRARGEGIVKLMGSGTYKSKGFAGAKESKEKVEEVKHAEEAEILDEEAQSALQEF
mgnify:FL=1